MFSEHEPPLIAAYVAGLGGWLVACRMFPELWTNDAPKTVFPRPWREFAIALLAAVGVLVLGQLWMRGIRLPEQGAIGPCLAAVNQALIFTPMLLVPVLRRHPWTTAWLPRRRITQRLVVGLLLAGLAVTTYALLRIGADEPWIVFGRIWRYDHVDEMTQVFLEDLTIAILFVRLAAAIGSRRATVVVACLFAAGHIPTMISNGATWLELAGLLRDAGLGVAAISVLARSRDVVWFWCIHFCLDMTQYARITGV